MQCDVQKTRKADKHCVELHVKRTLSSLVIGLLLQGCASGPSPVQAQPAPSPPPPGWLVLYYGSADCDLEAHMMDDLQELASVGGSEPVQLLALVDRSRLDSKSSGYSDERVRNLKSWSGAKLLHPTPERIEVLSDWGETNMADEKTFERFLREGLKRYPKRRIVVILSGHGVGPYGMAQDDGAPDDLLSPQEMRQAFRQTGLHAELLGLDACLMSHLEIARELAPCAEVLVASQESEPESGWDYASLMRSLHGRPDMSAVHLGGVVSRTYQRSFDRNIDSSVQEEGRTITLSVVQLKRLQPIQEALNQVAEICLEDAKVRGQLLKTMQKTHHFGISDPREEGEVPYYDCQQLAHQLGRIPRLKEAAKALDESCRQAVALKVQGRDQSLSGGLSVSLEENIDETSAWARLGQKLPPQ